MVNYVLSFCKITGASRIFSRNFYLPLLKPLTPKEALRTFRITGKWLLGAKIQHYIPVLLNHKKKRSKRLRNFGKKVHRDMEDYTYMTPVLDAENESHKLLLTILDSKKANGSFVYTVHDKKYNIVLQAQLERAILDGDVVDVLVSQRNDKIIVKLKSMKKIPIEIQYYDGDEKMYCGEGATSPEDEKFHHHGKYTMSLAKMFEEKELVEEKWEEELKKMMRRRKRQAKEGSKEWREMMKETIKNLDWKKFEEDAKKVIEEIEEPAAEKEIEMEIDDLEMTKNVNETILKRGSELLDQLPTMKEIPDIIKSMGNATLHEIEDEEDDENLAQQCSTKRRVSGVKVKLSSGKECFVSGQMVHTEEGDVFVPGQTVENEFGLEYAPGITINVDNKPTLISGLIMGEEERDPMFLPTQSTITADGQLTFATTVEERPKPQPEKQKLKKKQRQEEVIEEDPETEPEIIVDDASDVVDSVSEDKSIDVSSIELNNSEIEEFDAEATRLKQEQQRLEIEKLKSILMDDGLDDVIASIEDKRAKLQQKLEELRKLSINTENSFITYVNESDTTEIASKITDDKETINRLSDILMTMTRRAATFRDRNSVNADNINQAYISVSNLSEADVRFNNSPNKLKIMLKTAAVAANDVFKTRPKDQLLALHAIADIIADIDERTLREWLDLMNTPIERSEVCGAIFKQLTQNITETKISFLNDIARNVSAYDVIDCVEKVLKKQAEIQCEAFVKVAKVDPEIINLLVRNVKEKVTKVRTEEDAMELLQSSIEEASRALMKANFRQLKGDVSTFKEEAISFARALGMGSVEDCLSEVKNFDAVSDKRTVELLERMTLIRQLAERDYSLKSAIERLKKNPERGRSDPRIRQLIRESAVLISRGAPLRNSRDIPYQILKTQNLLALEDFLMQRTKVEYPILISRDNMQAVIPKEASRGVLAGRVPYALIDESGVTNMFSSGGGNKVREMRIEDFSGVRERSGERDDDRKYLQAKSNVRKLKKLFSNNSRQVA
ncbi:AAA 13 domain containing protein [Asbolus verrucosus]|uniref:AAA 13 domain containing protein n=1 Tax=Asbolus verrucosus TaxID=1661398 RepID=A0A482W801_ASBVE|nr:AAA 13 domain containing protein [Asbolus verrucosus]